MASLSSLAFLVVAAGLGYIALVIRYRRRAISRIAGPPSPSWLYGNLKQFLFDYQYGANEFKWTARYGTIYRLKGCFGQDLLVISDPTALKYVFGNLQFFTRSSFALQALRTILPSEKNLISAEGDDHARYRGVMNSAFAAGRVKGLIPNLSAHACSLVEQWRTALEDEGERVDVYRSVYNLTLDAAGAAIGIEFNAIENAESDFVKSQHDTGFMAGKRSELSVLGENLFLQLPVTILRLALRLPTADFLRLRHTRALNSKLSEQVLQNHLEALKLNFEPAKDLFDAVLRNNIETPSLQNMNEEELHAQVAMMILAAQDTTANTLSWTLYQLAQDLDWQEKVRSEIFASCIDSTPDGANRVAYDSLKYLNAHIKETLRYHTTLPFLEKTVSKDTVIPLSSPITTTMGEKISELPVEKGQMIYLAMSSYNRLEYIWGKDAQQFYPQRWLKDSGAYTQGYSLGPYANLMTFGSGPKSCIGWRYAIVVLQVTLVELLRAFRFTIPKDAPVVRRRAVLALLPTSEEGTPSLPLVIQPV